MKKLLLIVFLLVTSPVFAEKNPFLIFDNFDYYSFKNLEIKIDGKLNDTCMAISKAFEKQINENVDHQVRLKLIEVFKPSIDFIKFCVKEGLIKWKRLIFY